MRKFVKKALCLFALSGIMIMGVYMILSISGSSLTSLNYGMAFIRKKAQMVNDCTTVYLSDSVCSALWSVYDEDVDGVCHEGYM